jgi:branched-chain amino acid transport system substrate-binding protein
MHRRVVTLLASVALVTAVAACSSSGSSGSAGSSGSSTGPILAGVVLPLTGAEETPGQDQLYGIEAAVDYVNGHGGILGRQVKLLTKDSGGSPVQAVADFKQLAAEHINVIFGDLLSSYDAMVPLFKQDNIISISQNTTDSTWANVSTNPNGFNIFCTTTCYAQVYVNYLQSVDHVTKIGVIGGNDDFGTSLTTAVQQVAAAKGIKVYAEEFSDSATDITPQMRALKNDGVQGLISATYSGTQILSIKAQQALGWDPPSVTSNTLNDSAGVAAVKSAGLKNIVGGVVSSFMLQSTAGAAETAQQKTFLTYVQKAVGSGTSLDGVWSDAILGFDGVLVYQSAVDKAGTTDTATVKKVLESGTPLKGWSGDFEYSATSHVTKNAASLFGLYQGGVDCPGACPAAAGSGS